MFSCSSFDDCEALPEGGNVLQDVGGGRNGLVRLRVKDELSRTTSEGGEEALLGFVFEVIGTKLSVLQNVFR